MPGDLNPFTSTEDLLTVHPMIPGSGGRGWLQENVNPKEGVEDPALGQGHSWRGDSEHPAGAEGKGNGGVWEASFAPRIISHKLCQLSAVK